MEYVIKKLNDYDLAHLLMMGATTDFMGGPLEHLAGDGMFQHFRPLYNGHLIANVEMTQERGNRLIRAGLADSIAFGRPFIANPDLPERFLTGAILNEIHWPTVYASGPEGYIDYAESLVADIRSKGKRADAIRADLGTPDGAALLAKEVRSIVGERLDVLVLNAGISKAARIMDHTVEDFDNLFAINVRGPFFLVQQLLPVLGERSNIIVISSAVARTVVGKAGLENPSILAYASTKGALETLVRNWAAILGPHGIRVNAVAPGVIDTDMSNFTKTEAGREVALGMQALKRIGKSEDVADVVAFLASEATRWITGASIPVDGGSKL
jgi:3-oxoacyl-[acyl-carrier protein] reductase